MLRLFSILLLLPLLAVHEQSQAFSLAGPQPPWMQEASPSSADCYNLPLLLNYSGPMMIDEEYRFNTPVVTYGFTSDFVSFFGARGMDEVRKAVQIINDLPPVDQIDVNDYPKRSFRLNHRAGALGLTDLKSTALQKILHFLGLEDPTLWAFAPRNAWIQNGVVLQYLLELRNYDPLSYRASPYINETLYTVQRLGCPTVLPAQPYQTAFAANTPVAARGNGRVTEFNGVYATGLTRDDVGGLKYLYHPQNYNFEPGLPNLALQTNGLSGFSASGESFRIVPASNTNLFGFGGPYDSAVTLTNATAAGGLGGAGSSPFDSAVSLTNITAGGAGGGGIGGGIGGGVAAGNQPLVVANALRPGMGEIVLRETNYDSLLGEFFSPLNVLYTETIVTNGVKIQQRVVRNITAPDLVFDAKDLQGAFAADPPIVVIGAHGMTFINGDTVDPNPGDDMGPGIIQDGSITFSTGGLNGVLLGSLISPVDAWFQEGVPNFLDSQHIWAAFDGSTNDPVVFPQGIDFEEIERLALGRSRN